MANQSKLQQQERKAQKKGKQKIQNIQEKIHDIVNGDKNTRKKTETQNKWQLHENNRNEKRSQEFDTKICQLPHT